MPPEELVRLAIASSDELSRLNSLPQLLKISLEQFDQPNEQTLDRVDLLLTLHLFHAEVHLRELADQLHGIRQQLKLAAELPQQPESPAGE